MGRLNAGLSTSDLRRVFFGAGFGFTTDDRARSVIEHYQRQQAESLRLLSRDLYSKPTHFILEYIVVKIILVEFFIKLGCFALKKFKILFLLQENKTTFRKPRLKSWNLFEKTF